MARFNTDLKFIDLSGQVRAVHGDLTLRANEAGGGHIIVGSGISLRPEVDCDASDAIDLGQDGLRWKTLFSCSGNFLDRPTVNGSGVLLVGEATGGGSGVTSLNELTSDIDIVGVSGIDVATSGQNILIGTNPSGLTEILMAIGFSGMFGNVISTAITDQTTNSATFIEALSLAIPTSGGLYRIGWNVEGEVDSDGKQALYRTQLDDTIDLMDIGPSFSENDTTSIFCGFSYQPLDEGTHNIDIDFAVADTGVFNTIRRARIEAWRVGNV